MAVRVAEHEAEIARVQRLIRGLPRGMVRADQRKYLSRLQAELAECKMYLAKRGINECRQQDVKRT